MHPILLRVGQLEYHTYGFAVVCAFVVLLAVARLGARPAGLDPALVPEAGVALLLGGVVGARLVYLMEHRELLENGLRGLLPTGRGGMSSLGVMIGALAAGLAYSRWRPAPLRPWMDVFAPGAAAAHLVLRLGCLSAGCCHGRPSSGGSSVVFTDPAVRAPRFVPLEPTQALYVGAAIATFALLLVLARSMPRPGGVMGLFLVFYGVTRLPIDGLRAVGSPARASLLAALIGLGLLVQSLIAASGSDAAEEPFGPDPLPTDSPGAGADEGEEEDRRGEEPGPGL